ncbi:ATP-binding protein [Erysipelothrix rhusiopathiae]|nr:ATP-binding protein [Erysipelothrix rhusiopathiae]
MNRNFETDFVVGTVREIKGTSIIVRMFDNSNQLFYFYNEHKYSGVVIGSFIGIRRNQYIIVGKVEKEYAFDTLNDPSIREFKKERFVREIEVKVLGNIYYNKYTMGMEAFPQVFSDVILLSNEQKKLILGVKDETNGEVIAEGSMESNLPQMVIGKLWPEGIDFNLKWYDFFNSHIAIFGNTGSGKSNTLAKIYHELFTYRYNDSKLNFSKSKFLLLDFNGEYIGDKCIVKNKDIIELNTRDSKEYFKITESNFWSKDMLSVLFGATEQTQQPFLTRVIDFYFDKKSNFNDELPKYIKQAFSNVYSAPNKHGLDLLKKVIKMLDLKNDDVSEWIDKTLSNSSNDSFYSKEYIENWNPDQYQNRYYWNGESEYLSKEKDNVLSSLNEKIKKIDNVIVQLQIAAYFRLIFELRYNMAQYDHISPLINRMDARISDFTKVIEIVPDGTAILGQPFTILSLKDVNQDMKQLVPLIVAKSTYDSHKNNKLMTSYFNLIVDEAHNILSESSKRESEKWKDYRLEVFEEIIKEGRKFGYFLTISSQRPADISPTIVSQVHNYFIHRLVNDNDLKLLDNTLTSLDRVSKDSIPNLSPGQTILTGVLFDLPLTIKVDMLPDGIAPNSKNISLINEWISEKAK